MPYQCIYKFLLLLATLFYNIYIMSNKEGVLCFSKLKKELELYENLINHFLFMCVLPPLNYMHTRDTTLRTYSAYSKPHFPHIFYII